MHTRFLLVVVVLSCHCVLAQTQDGELRRQVFLGVTLSSPNASGAGAAVKQVVDAAIAAQTGLRQNDRILRINCVWLDSAAALQRVLISLRAGDTTRFEIVRDGKPLNYSATLQGLPREQLKGVETVYDAALVDRGFRVRTIITHPQNTSGRLPTVFLVGWLSCDSVEYPFGPGDDGFGQLLHDLATQSGHVLVRMDKPGVGDSEGPNCSETDFQTELAAYRAAFSTLKRYD